MHYPNKALVTITIFSLLFLSACAARRTNVVIDPTGVDMQYYQRDLAECRQLSAQVEPKAGRGAVGGAIVGGAIGGVIGGSEIARKGAGVGAIRGTTRGAVATKAERDRVVKSCLSHRGYAVLN